MFWKRGGKLSLTPLGGIGYVGHNSFLVSEGENALVLDCGIRPQTHEVGDSAGNGWKNSPPRLDILDEAERNTVGIITHAHLDHIGAVAELIRRDIPVYLSQESMPFAERYSENLEIPQDAEFRIFNKGQTLTNGNLEISFMPVQHSIPGTHAVLVRSGKKSILYLADFKLNGMRDTLQESRNIFREMRSRAGRINCLVMDILNAEIGGFTPPEYLVLDSVESAVKNARGRVFITFFSSNIRRMAGILRIAKSYRRTVGASGQNMRGSYRQLKGHLPSKQGDIILVSGSQGEENSGLVRMAHGEHQFLRIGPRDTIIVSSRCIPGNENAIKACLERLHKRGARILLHRGEGKNLNLSFRAEERFFHVSGHGYRGDQQEAVEILQPEIIVPFHAPEDRYYIFEESVGGRKTKRLQVGETLKI